MKCERCGYPIEPTGSERTHRLCDCPKVGTSAQVPTVCNESTTARVELTDDEAGDVHDEWINATSEPGETFLDLVRMLDEARAAKAAGK